MNYKDFEIARKKRKTELAHKAIIRKMAEKRLSRPRCEKNISTVVDRRPSVAASEAETTEKCWPPKISNAPQGLFVSDRDRYTLSNDGSVANSFLTETEVVN